MRRVTATEAARRFADMLDSVETGRESFVIVRRGREIATITPAAPASGKRLKTLLEQHRPDPTWPAELAELRARLRDEPARWSD